MTEARMQQLRREENTTEQQHFGTADLVERTEEHPIESAQADGRTPLFQENELSDFRQYWQQAQTEFVDDPRTAVRRADELVASVMKRLAEVFAVERERLEHDWDQGEKVSTEDLRQVLRRYRSFFDRLLSV
jgi:hypothetical protein